MWLSGLIQIFHTYSKHYGHLMLKTFWINLQLHMLKFLKGLKMWKRGNFCPILSYDPIEQSILIICYSWLTVNISWSRGSIYSRHVSEGLAKRLDFSLDFFLNIWSQSWGVVEHVWPDDSIFRLTFLSTFQLFIFPQHVSAKIFTITYICRPMRRYCACFHLTSSRRWPNGSIFTQQQFFCSIFWQRSNSLNITRLHSTHSTRWPDDSMFARFFVE